MSLLDIGDYTVGEKPAPIVVTFTDNEGDVIDLTGYTAKWNQQREDDAATTSTAEITDADAGQVTYSFTASDFDEVGLYEGQMWVGNGVNRFASVRYQWRVVDAVGTAPNI